MSQCDEIYKLASNGNKDAYAFLCQWNKLLHNIDDFIDEDKHSVMSLLCNTLVVSTSPFWRDFGVALLPLVFKIAIDYEESLTFQGEPWKETWADYLRFSGNDMVVAVASLCGGYEVAKKVSSELKECAYKTHHDEKGNPI